MNDLKYLQSKKITKLEKELNNIYNYKIKVENIKRNTDYTLYNYLSNIHRNNDKLEKLNSNLKNFNDYKYIHIENNNYVDYLLYSILYCIDPNINFLNVNIFLKEFKQYILYSISNFEFDDKNKVLKNLQNDDNINHLSLVALSNYLNINIYIIRKNNLYKIVSNNKYKNIILIKNNKKYYSVYNHIEKTFFNDISEIENIFSKYTNYDFDYLKSISYYKVDELRNIGKLFDINIMNEKGKKKTKQDLYIEINNNI
tara:strand:+ start:182 stop:949 length:768 start_codon:yes stop_codon:yes gene_type:complete